MAKRMQLVIDIGETLLVSKMVSPTPRIHGKTGVRSSFLSSRGVIHAWSSWGLSVSRWFSIGYREPSHLLFVDINDGALAVCSVFWIDLHNQIWWLAHRTKTTLNMDDCGREAKTPPEIDPFLSTHFP